jgi:hypothetical protein
MQFNYSDDCRWRRGEHTQLEMTLMMLITLLWRYDTLSLSLIKSLLPRHKRLLKKFGCLHSLERAIRDSEIRVSFAYNSGRSHYKDPRWEELGKVRQNEEVAYYLIQNRPKHRFNGDDILAVLN